MWRVSRDFVSRLIFFGLYVEVSNMNPTDLVKNQAALDQAWKAMEPMMLRVIEIAERGLGPHSNGEDLAIAKMCAQLVEWELNTRIMQRDYFVRCIVYKGMFSDELAVRISTLNGHMSFMVPRDSVTLDKPEFDFESKENAHCRGKLQVKAAVTPNGYAIVLPTEYQDVVFVRSYEVTTE